jgi:flagellar hook-associated protein 2
MTSPSSFNVSGLLGSNSIDTTALISQLMQAQAIPQTQLKNELVIEQAIKSAYQAINTKLSALQTAAQALTNPTIPTDPTAWTATAATSSSSAVVATSTGAAAVGSSTFDVLQLARAQVTTVAVNTDGTVVSDLATGITIGSHSFANLASGQASDVASVINAANIGVRASVITTDAGQVLQLTGTTGLANAFGTSGFANTPTDVVAAQNAQIGVGDPLAGGYVVSRPTNTFTDVIPGVTFTVGAVATGVTISVTSDAKGISDKLAALVAAANAARTEIGNDSGKGAILEGNYDVMLLGQGIGSAVSNGVTGGGTLKTYGIDMDKDGVITFDATAFQAAYAADSTGTRNAIAGSFAAALNTLATNASDPITGTVTAAITSASNASDDLNKRIDAWTSRLADIQARLQDKYTAMNAALARLQSQSTYLTNMLKSLNSTSSGSGSGSS